MPRPLTNAEARDLNRALRAAVRELDRAEPPMSQAAYARSRGYSRQYIGRCLEKGVIHRAIVTINSRRLLDPTIADEEMADNRPDATSGCWHEARGLERPRRHRADERAETLIDDVLIPFSMDLFDGVANSLAVYLREDCGMPAAHAFRHLEVGFLLFWKHLGIALGRPDLALEEDRIPDLIRQLGTKAGRAKLIAALDARPPHPPDETGPAIPRRRTPTHPEATTTPRS